MQVNFTNEEHKQLIEEAERQGKLQVELIHDIVVAGLTQVA